MHSIHETSLKSNPKIKIDFDGGTLSTDAGLLLIKEFLDKLGLPHIFKALFKTNDKALFREHTDYDNLVQAIIQIVCAYYTDDSADALRYDPVFTTVLEKPSLASQPTMSRFFNRMDETTLNQLELIHRILRKIIYSIEQPECIVCDLDTTLLPTHGSQEGALYNVHYQGKGYHPLLCYDAMTHDLIKAELRPGTQYCSKDADKFLEDVLKQYREDFPDLDIVVRADSGFAAPSVYSICEKYDAEYVIRLKENPNLIKLAKDENDDLTDITKDNMVKYAVVYGDFMYQAGSWDHPRRVVFKIEKPENQIVHDYTFVVTSFKSRPDRLIKLYSKRGNMENFIKEGKNEFDFAAVSSASMIVNANRLQIHMLAYNIFNWFRRLVLPANMRHLRANTLRMMLIKVAVRVVKKARYLHFKICSSFPYKTQFIEIIENIENLRTGLRLSA